MVNRPLHQSHPIGYLVPRNEYRQCAEMRNRHEIIVKPGGCLG